MENACRLTSPHLLGCFTKGSAIMQLASIDSGSIEPYKAWESAPAAQRSGLRSPAVACVTYMD
jgi:hypothetical protein